MPSSSRSSRGCCCRLASTGGVWKPHDSLLAFDLLPGNVDSSRLAVRRALASDGVESSLADALSERWVRCGDFLLDPPLERSVDFALGNPPYVRLESVPRERSDAYRRACRTMGGRADVYVGFYEHALRALRDGGVLSFICADRWMRNAYGARLRAMVTEGWAVDVLISMTGVDAFEDEVDAYPAVTVLRRGRQTRGPLVIEATPGFDERGAREVAGFARGYGTETATGRGYRAARLHGGFQGQAGWPSGIPRSACCHCSSGGILSPLEDPDTGTRVGIGIATGADKVFIVEDPDLVEPQRLLPLALPRDIASGRVEWSGEAAGQPLGCRWSRRSTSLASTGRVPGAIPIRAGQAPHREEWSLAQDDRSGHRRSGREAQALPTGLQGGDLPSSGPR